MLDNHTVNNNFYRELQGNSVGLDQAQSWPFSCGRGHGFTCLMLATKDSRVSKILSFIQNR